MGTEASPSDVRRGRRKVIDELARDLDPATREAIANLSDRRRRDESEEELKRVPEKRPGRRPARARNA
jgi:hypothetical protein